MGVTHGLYSRIRVSVNILLAGVILVLHWPWLFVILLVIIAGQTWQARREARVLEQKFGQEYTSYRQRTWL